MQRKHSDARLLKLADYLEKLPRGAIKMDAWLTDNKVGDNYTTLERLNGLAEVKKGRKVKLKAAPVEEVRGCGFAACAVGWACTIPEFRKAGLRLEAKQESKHDSFAMWPKYNGLKGFEAAAKFFGIEPETAEYLFDGDSFGWSAKPRPSSVARRLRKVVERRAAGKTEVPDSFWANR